MRKVGRPYSNTGGSLVRKYFRPLYVDSTVHSGKIDTVWAIQCVVGTSGFFYEKNLPGTDL